MIKRIGIVCFLLFCAAGFLLQLYYAVHGTRLLLVSMRRLHPEQYAALCFNISALLLLLPGAYLARPWATVPDLSPGAFVRWIFPKRPK